MSNMKPPRTIAFDLDGTLIDTHPSITIALNATLARYGFPTVEPIFVKTKIGLPVENLFSHLEITQDEGGRLVQEFRMNLRESLSKPEDVFPGVNNLLSNLLSSGAILAVATSKPTELAVLTLKVAGILNYFQFVIGSDNGRYKPDPWVLLEAKSRMSKKLDLFVGDRLEDAEAAKNAAVPFIGVLNSIHNRIDFQKFPNIGICENAFEINHILQSNSFI